MGKKIGGVVYDVPPPRCKEDDCDNYLTEHEQLKTGLCGECGEGSEKEAALMKEFEERQREERNLKLAEMREAAKAKTTKPKEVTLDFEVAGPGKPQAS